MYYNKHDGKIPLLLEILHLGTSLAVQWLRVCLPMHGTQVRSLARELKDPTCHRAAKPSCHN